MNSSRANSLIVGLLLLLMVVSHAEAAPSRSRGKTNTVKIGAGGQQSQQQLQSALQGVDKKLQDGQKSLGEAQKKSEETLRELQKAAAAHKNDQRQLSQIKKLAEEEARNDPVWKSARAKADDLRDRLAEVRRRVVSNIKNKEDYQAAVKAHEAAVAAKFSASGADLTEEMRKTLTKNASATEQAIRLIEDVAMANNSEAKTLTQQLQEAEADVAEAARRRKDSLENDPQMSNAKRDFVQSLQVQKAAEQRHAQAQGDVQRIQSGLQSLNAQKASLNSQMQIVQKMQSAGGRSNNTKRKK